MKLISKITSEAELLAHRDHIQKVLKEELSLNLGKSKLNERVASLLGAKNWNDALWLVNSIKPQQSLVETLSGYQEKYAMILSQWIEKKLSIKDLQSLINSISYTISENSKSEYEQLTKDTIFNNLNSLDKTTDIWLLAEGIMFEFGLSDEEFIEYLTSVENNKLINVKENSMTDNENIDISRLDKNKNYSSDYLLSLIENNLLSLIRTNPELDFENIEVSESFLKFEYNLLSHKDLPKENDYNSSFTLELFIEHDEDEKKMVFYGDIGFWDSELGRLNSNSILFDNYEYLTMDKPVDLPQDAFELLLDKLTKFLSEINFILNLNTF